MSELFTQSEAGKEAMELDVMVRSTWEENGLRSKVVAKAVGSEVVSQALDDGGSVQFYLAAFTAARRQLFTQHLQAFSQAASQYFLEPEIPEEFFREELKIYKELVAGHTHEGTGVLWDYVRSLQPEVQQLSQELNTCLQRVRVVQQGNAKRIGQLLIGSGVVTDLVLRQGYDAYTHREDQSFVSEASKVFLVVRRSLEQLLLRQLFGQGENSAVEQEVYRQFQMYSSRRLRAPTGVTSKEKLVKMGPDGALWTMQHMSLSANSARELEETVQGWQQDASVQVSAWRQSQQMLQLNTFAGNGEFVAPEAGRQNVPPWGKIQYGFRRGNQEAVLVTTAQSQIRELQLRTASGECGTFGLTDERVAAGGHNMLLAPLPESEVSAVRRADASLHQSLEGFWHQNGDIVDLASKIQPVNILEVPEGVLVFLPEGAVAQLPSFRHGQLLTPEQVRSLYVQYPEGTAACLQIQKRIHEGQVSNVSDSAPVQPEYRIRELLNRRGHLDTSTFSILLRHLEVARDTTRGKGSHESLENNGHRANLSGETLVSSYRWSPDRIIRKLRELSVNLEFFYNVLRTHYKE